MSQRSTQFGSLEQLWRYEMEYFENANEEPVFDADEETQMDFQTQHPQLYTNQGAYNEQIIGLLQMMGIPYINAPFEAEAQCAFLEKHRLIDGTATEDSDAFLFGCQKVYKCLFSRASAPIEFTTRRIDQDLGLEAGDLITMALFMGCDYTPGVHGIAAVNAIEIINCFGSSEEDLARFRSWVDINTQIKDKLEAGTDPNA